ncbi:MAG: UvrD-helicase domain-containing protein [Thermoanaerobaculia bacterium]|nr:UvrD-helicase domain-containing protein [Thermoanaerobaculia bacterium]
MSDREQQGVERNPADDQVARDRIVSDLQCNFVVEAAAGTGKTTNLVGRLVALVAEGVAEPSQIAAITFTKKAAGELRTRFQNALEREMRDGIRSPGQVERVRQALSKIDQSYVGTIHSFCGRMLRERPVEGGVPPDFVELEANETTAFNGGIWERYVQKLYLQRSELLEALEQTDITIADLRDRMLSLSDETDLDLVHEKPGERPRPDLRDAWRELIRATSSLAEQMPPELHENGPDDLQKALFRTRALRGDPNPDTLTIVRLLKDFEFSNPDDKVKPSRWKKGLAEPLREQLRELCEQTITPALREWREFCHPIVIEIIEPAIRMAREERIAAGQLSFQDLLTLARDLLRDHQEIRLWFRNRYRFVLVDEFQDTDPIQAEILFYLTGEGDSDDWRELRPREGSLFIVGDPKQSIYRFRRADIELYQEVKRRIVDSGGEALQLTRNFRSTPALCEWLNERFSGILPDEETPQQAAMVEVEAHREDRGGFQGVFHHQYSGYASKVASEEGRKIAAWIRDAVEHGRTIVEDGIEREMRWSDFMLLAPDRNRLHCYADAMEVEMIPYEITGARGFGRSVELRALAAFLRAVIDPDDEVSLVAYLRGRLSGVSDDELWRYRRVGGWWSYLSDPPDETPELIRRAMQHLRESRREALELPPAAVIARAIERLGLTPWSLVLDGGQTRSGNLYKAVAIARRMSAQGSSLTAIVEELTRLTEERNDIEELSLRGGSGDVVRIMNLHQAKGLEAPVVFLVDPNDGRDHDPEIRVERLENPPRAHVAVTKPVGFSRSMLAHPRNWEVVVETEQKFLKAEDDRLLYVAATRARQALIVSTKLSKDVVAGPWEQLHSDDLPELPPKVSEVPEPVDRELELDLEEELETLEARRSGIARSSWEIRSVTAGGHELLAADARGGRGASWGRVLHRALEVVMRHDSIDVAQLAGNLLREEGRSDREAEEVVAWVNRVRSTDLWRRARTADAVHVEMPFATVVTEAEREILTRGVADLVFREQGGWVIVDYKSDTTAGRLDDLVRAYTPQVEAYVRVWQEQTGKETVGYLLFLDGSHEVKVAHLPVHV